MAAVRPAADFGDIGTSIAGVRQMSIRSAGRLGLEVEILYNKRLRAADCAVRRHSSSWVRPFLEAGAAPVA